MEIRTERRYMVTDDDPPMVVRYAHYRPERVAFVFGDTETVAFEWPATEENLEILKRAVMDMHRILHPAGGMVVEVGK